MAIAACPALIMTLVGSLVIMLLEASYSGPWLGSMRWTLCWFTFAIVLVSRIAIERTRPIAIGYGILVAGATSLFLISHFGFILPVWILLGVIWWIADRMTWDCTLIDDDVDSSGLGLLQGEDVSKLAKSKPALVKIVGPPQMPAGTPAKPSPTAAQPKRLKRPAKKQRLHAPGLWVLYFSIAAIPLFGLGEILLPSSEPAARRFAFWLLIIYLGSAAALLLLTSFLGLRRYLRQRWIQMPAGIAFYWVKSGVFFIACLLLIAILLPRPVTSYSLDRLVTSKENVESGRGQKREAPEDKKDVTKEMTESKSKQPGGKPQEGKLPPPASSPNKEALHLPTWPHWLSRLVAALVFIVILFRYWPEILAALRAFLESLRFSFGGKPKARKGIFGRSSARNSSAGVTFANPFQSGQAAQMTPADLLRYTFDAVKAWAVLRGAKPEDSDTPVELAERLSTREPALAREILLIGRYYSHLAYAGRIPPAEAQPVLQKLWTFMTFNPSPGRRLSEPPK